jgi:hypothetical protein
MKVVLFCFFAVFFAATAAFADESSCNFPGTTAQAPAWVCSSHVDGWKYSAVGSFRRTADENFQKNMATMSARATLAKMLGVNEIVDSRRIKTTWTPDGTVYVLVAMN